VNNFSSPKRRLAIWTVPGGIVLLFGGLWLAGAFHGARPIPPEKIVTVERGDLSRSVVARGKVEPRSSVGIKSKANGIIKELLVDVGQPVTNGQVVAELDKEDLAAQVREAKAGLEGMIPAARASRLDPALAIRSE